MQISELEGNLNSVDNLFVGFKEEDFSTTCKVFRTEMKEVNETLTSLGLEKNSINCQ